MYPPHQGGALLVEAFRAGNTWLDGLKNLKLFVCLMIGGPGYMGVWGPSHPNLFISSAEEGRDGKGHWRMGIRGEPNIRAPGPSLINAG